MPIAARIRELDARHTRLDTQIDEVTRHPSVDSLELARLKKEKLRLKEQIEALRMSAHSEQLQ
ncbi:YdcH family protein [Maricaulis sp. CAU 1757]